MSTGWKQDALCAALPTEAWLVEPLERSVATERALGAVCAACPVSSQCAEYVEDLDICSGFWAGQDRTPPAAEAGAA